MQIYRNQPPAMWKNKKVLKRDATNLTNILTLLAVITMELIKRIFIMTSINLRMTF